MRRLKVSKIYCDAVHGYIEGYVFSHAIGTMAVIYLPSTGEIRSAPIGQIKVEGYEILGDSTDDIDI